MKVFITCFCCFFFQAEDGIRDLVRSRGLGDVYKRQRLEPADRQSRRSNNAPAGRTVVLARALAPRAIPAAKPQAALAEGLSLIHI